jgi:hypothetical protein
MSAVSAIFPCVDTQGSHWQRIPDVNSGANSSFAIVNRAIARSASTRRIRPVRDSNGSDKNFEIRPENIRSSVAERFDALASRWEMETSHLSRVEQRIMHPCYQKIIAMGPIVLPHILHRLRDRPDHWFWALNLLANENPVPPDFRGTASDAARLWVEWGERQGYV